MKTIGLIGAGHIGGQLARLAVKNGYRVVVSNSRGPETLADLRVEAPLARVEEILDLRWTILRAGLPRESANFEGDDESDADMEKDLDLERSRVKRALLALGQIDVVALRLPRLHRSGLDGGQAIPGVVLAPEGVVLAERDRVAARVHEVMAAVGDAVLIVGVPVHERLDGDGEHVIPDQGAIWLATGHAELIFVNLLEHLTLIELNRLVNILE